MTNDLFVWKEGNNLIHSLRKGTHPIYVQHLNTGHNINAEKFECEVLDNNFIFRFTLKPAGVNQKLDEEMIHREKLVSIELDDEKIISELGNLMIYHEKEFTNINIELISCNTKKVFGVNIDKKWYKKTQNLKFLV